MTDDRRRSRRSAEARIRAREQAEKRTQAARRLKFDTWLRRAGHQQVLETGAPPAWAKPREEA